MKTFFYTGNLAMQPSFEDEDRAARRVSEARVLVARKEDELDRAKAWLAKCESWLAEFEESAA